jgi:hypothetical protein
MSEGTIRERLAWELTPESCEQVRLLWIERSVAEEPLRTRG